VHLEENIRTESEGAMKADLKDTSPYCFTLTTGLYLAFAFEKKSRP
jgi:hypothetical protein